MRIQIKKNSIIEFLRVLAFSLFLFSSACFWEENSLHYLLISGLIIMVLSILIMTLSKTSVVSVINCRALWWIVINYLFFEIYGLLFLRAGSFNWDFMLFNEAILICIIFICISVPSVNETIDLMIKSCMIGILATGIYMYNKTDIHHINLTLGTRLGDSLSGNVNTVATCFGIMFLPVFYSVVTKNKGRFRGVICCAVALICMLLTGSKKSMLVLVISIFMFLFLYKHPVKFVAFPLIVIGVLYATFNVQALYNTIGFRIIDMLAALGIGQSVTVARSTSERLHLIIIGFKSFLYNPIFGGGMNYFQYINSTPYYSHNNFIEVLNNFGIIGFFIHYSISFKAFFYFVKNIKAVDCNKEKIYILCISLIATKYLFDIAMVSFSSLGIYYLLTLIPILVIHKDKHEQN